MICLKKLILFFILLVCFSSVRASEPSGELKIVTSFYPMYIMAKNVAGGVPGVSVENLTPPLTGCLHDYALTSADMKKLSDAQVLVVNGAGMESFLGKVAAQYPDLKVVELSRGMPLIKGGEDNPHVWVSISCAITETKNLGEALEKIDPAHQEFYRKNTADYIVKLEALRQKMHQELAAYKGKQIITFHEAFPYFAREFGFNIAAVIEREPGAQPSAKELAETIELVKKSGIAVIFSEPQYPAAAAQVISRESGARVYLLDPAVTGPDDLDAYIRIMEENLTVLKAAFQE